jgi:hypothetical protein
MSERGSAGTFLYYGMGGLFHLQMWPVRCGKLVIPLGENRFDKGLFYIVIGSSSHCGFFRHFIVNAF